MNKILISIYKGGILTSVWEDRRLCQFEWEKQKSNSLVGNIYVGIVQKIMPGIQAAFIDVGGGKTGYYSLTDNKQHIFLTEGRHDRIREGDMILVQVERDPVKTKAMVLTGKLNLTGRYVALTCGYPGLAFSAQLKDSKYDELREQLSETLSGFPTQKYGLIVRTNAMSTGPATVKNEAFLLWKKLESIRSEASYRLSGSLMLEALPGWLQSVRDCRDDEVEEIVTDNGGIFARLLQYTRDNSAALAARIRYYSDDYPLYKLYSVDTAIEKALAEKVWLKSGGFLVIQPTEAMTVIDVNTGKYAGNKAAEDTFLNVNLEAAKEIAFQLRLRNLSGIIVVDFIDMESEEHRQTLLKQLEKFLSEDRIKTTLVGMTKLGLVEITRKRVKRPVAEQLAGEGPVEDDEKQ